MIFSCFFFHSIELLLKSSTIKADKDRPIFGFCVAFFVDTRQAKHTGDFRMTSSPSSYCCGTNFSHLCIMFDEVLKILSLYDIVPNQFSVSKINFKNL